MYIIYTRTCKWMKLILPLSRICVRMLLKACIVHCSRHLIAVPQQVSVKSFLYSQTVILKTDSKILYYSILKLKYSPFIFKAQQRLIERCFVNSQNNCHRNYTNGIFLQIHMFRSIDLCILRDACHELFWIFGDSSASGTQHAGVTISLRFWEYGPQPWWCFKLTLKWYFDGNPYWCIQ